MSTVLAGVAYLVETAYYLDKIFGGEQPTSTQMATDIVNQLSTIMGDYYDEGLTDNASGALDALDGVIDTYCLDQQDGQTPQALIQDLGGTNGVAEDNVLQTAITQANDLYTAWTQPPHGQPGAVTPQQMQQMVALYLNLGVTIVAVCQELMLQFAAGNDPDDATDALNTMIIQAGQFASNGGSALNTIATDRLTFIINQHSIPGNGTGNLSPCSCSITDTWSSPETQGACYLGMAIPSQEIYINYGNSTTEDAWNYLKTTWPNIVSTYQDNFTPSNNAFASISSNYTNLVASFVNQMNSYCDSKEGKAGYLDFTSAPDLAALVTQITNFQSWFTGFYASVCSLGAMVPNPWPPSSGAATISPGASLYCQASQGPIIVSGGAGCTYASKVPGLFSGTIPANDPFTIYNGGASGKAGAAFTLTNPGSTNASLTAG